MCVLLSGETHSLRQNMWPHVFDNFVIPSSSIGWAGESIAAAISCSAKIAEKDRKHIGHVDSMDTVNCERLGNHRESG